MAQRLRALAALAEGLGSIPRIPRGESSRLGTKWRTLFPSRASPLTLSWEFKTPITSAFELLHSLRLQAQILFSQ